ncbi:cytochrome c oxidase subunit II [Piscinibacter sp.]|uniref:cytochrome c oxidase subunit II n=1 Tax=Piscinibacter sp. TaxID=1903157 RepID=UPI002D12A554|nr:cytochrome c oxidase subunit II [Albitalea sp.]HUG25038.1 cytochrome c oxidase subunit II [Albitalea sp.]
MLPALGACSGPQSILDPAGPPAAAVALLWWWMFGVAMVVLVGVVALWLVALWRRPRDYTDAQARRIQLRWILLGGIALPLGSTLVLLAFGVPTGRALLPLPDPAALRIDAIGHQWRWEIRYPGRDVRLDNELRLPVGRPIDVHTTSTDVIHSFWVPRLGGKVDAIPGRTNVVRLQADRPGRFRGQCAEFCGLNHAEMVLTVHAMTPEAFDAWLQAQPEAAK